MRIVYMIGALAVLICLMVIVGSSPHTAQAAEDVVMVEDNTDYPCTRDGLVSAIEAASTANPNQPGTVAFNCPTYIIDVTTSITIGAAGTQSVILDGSNSGGNQIVLDGENQSSLFVVAESGYLTLQHITLTNGAQLEDHGGAVVNLGTLKLEQSVFIDNQAQTGGVVSNHGDFIADASYFANNQATFGGAISNSGNATINQSTLTNNQASDTDGGVIDGDGGAIINFSNLTVAQSTLTCNHASRSGGAIANEGKLDIVQSTLTNNDSDGGGAIVNQFNSTLHIVKSALNDNHAIEGGAIDNFGHLDVALSTFMRNSATQLGGAIFFDLGSARIADSTFGENTTTSTTSMGSTLYVNFTTESTDIVWSTIVQPESGLNVSAIDAYGPLTLTGVILGGAADHCGIDLADFLTDNYTIANGSACQFTGPKSLTDLDSLGLGPATTTLIDGVPQTYYPLLTGSPAIDAGPATCDTDLIQGTDTDQLGNLRPQNDACDIGAVEVNAAIPTVSLCANAWSGQLTMAPESGQCSGNQTLIRLPEDAPLSLCVNNWNGSTTSDLQHRGCSRSEHQVTILGDQSIPVCISNNSRIIRVADTCTRTETSASL